MRKILLCFFFAAVALTISAQTNNSNEVTQAVEELTALYGLDAKQVGQMEVIQQRRFRNLAEITPLQSTDREKYLLKLDALRLGTEASIHRMLNQEQLVILSQQKKERRIQESEIIKELKEKGLSSEEMRLIVIERINS
jgi:hypothetical protein